MNATNKRISLIRPLLLGALLLLALPGWAQQPARPDTSRQQDVEVDHADVLEYIQRGDTVIQKLNGNVELRQDSVYMYCDTATIKNRTRVFANGQVIIQQGDSLNVFSDSAVYNGDTRIAELYGEVILEKGDQRLFTDRLTYNLG
ncbi:MAG: transcriptional initiation protein Tat, partial [Bacteroidetes bacterium]|nr:transcriptional initiation protein Tat [Bacteroidota bacterium]